MNYLSQFRAANPDLQGFSDDQIVEALPQLLPERFGGKPMSQVRAEALLAPEELEIRQYEQQGGGIGSSIERGLLRVNQTFNAAGAALGDAVMGALPESWQQSHAGQWLQGQADQDKQDVVRDQQRMSELPQRPEMMRAIEAANNAETGMGAIGAFAKEVWDSPDTAGFLVDTLAEQVPVIATMALGTKGAGGVFGTSSALGRAATFGTGAGIGSGSTTFGSNVAEAMGQDISKFDEATDYAFKRSLAQAMVDGTVGAVVPFKIGGNQIVNIPTQAVLQAAGGATGEYAGGAAVGEEVSKGELVAEGLLELLSLPADLAMANIEYFNSKRNPVGDASARVDAAGDQVAAAGGDALAQESAKAQVASSEIPGAVGEAKTIADTLKAAGQVSASDLGIQLPEQRDWSQFDTAPGTESRVSLEPRQAEQPAPRQSARDMSGLDGLIITADRMGFADEAALLRTSQRLYRQADEARARGDDTAASRFVERGNRLYREATETNDQVREIADQFPVPYVATGEVTGGEVGPYQGPGRTGETFDQPRSVGGPASLEQERTNRLTDSGIIFGEEPDYARVQRQQMESERAQRAADDFSARYGQEGQTPYRPDAIEGELDRSNELPPAQRQAALPPGTGQIDLGRDRTQQPVQSPQSGYTGIGRNTVERTAQAKTNALPAGNATRAITPQQYRQIMDQARLAMRTPVSRRTPEMTQALEVREQVRAGQVEVIEAQPAQTTPAPDLRMKANGAPFASERVAQASAAFRDNRDYASIVPVDGGFAVQVDTQARDQAEAQAADTAQAKSEQAKRRMFREPDTVNDDMLDAIALMGGIDRAEAEAEGIDPANFGRQAGGIRYVFPRQNGDSFDGMAERLAQYGYLDPRTDRLDDLRAKLDQAINGGRKIMTPEGYEALAEKELAAEAQLQEEHAPLADDITSDEAWAGEAYAMAAEAGVPINVIDAILEQYGADPIATLVELNDAINEVNNARAAQAGESTQGRSTDTEIPWNEPGNLSPEQAAEIFGEPEQVEPLLTAYTEADLQAQADARTAAEEADARAQREAEQKAQADAEVNDFTLSGSNRPADVAASRGQNDMFGLGGTPRAEQLAAQQQPEPETPEPVKSRVSVDTFNSWKRQGTAGTRKGWTIFKDDVRNQYALMRKTLDENAAGGGYEGADMVSGFTTRTQAEEWIDENAQQSAPQQAEPEAAFQEGRAEQTQPESEQLAQQLAEEMTPEQIRAELDDLSVTAQSRMDEAVETNGADALPAPIDYLTDSERERFNELQQALPSQAQERAEARQRIEQRAADRKARRDQQGSTVTANGVTIEVPAIDQQLVDDYNRATHMGRGRDLNAELRSEAEGLLNELAERKYTMDTPEQRAEAKRLIEAYLQAQAEFSQWDARYSASNPSWIVTGRSGRNMDRANRSNERHMDEYTKRVDRLQAQRDRIGDTLYRMRPQEVQENQALSADLRNITQQAGHILGYLEEGKNALVAETRKWASPKAHKLIERSLEADRGRTIEHIRELENTKAVQDAGGLVKVFGPRSKAGKLVSELLQAPPALQRRGFEPLGIESVVTADKQPEKGMPAEKVQALVDAFQKAYNGNVPLNFKVAATQEELYGKGATVEEYGVIKGSYHPASGEIRLAARNLSEMGDAVETLRHEVLGHYGLNTFTPADKRRILDQLIEARDSEGPLADTWAEIDELYADKSDDIRAEEVFAKVVESEPAKVGKLKAFVDRLLYNLNAAMRRAGIIKAPLKLNDVRRMARYVAEGIRSGRRQQQTFPASDEALFRRGGDADPAPELTEAQKAYRTLGNRDKKVMARLKRTFKRNFTAAGLLPDSVFREKILRDSEVNAHEFDTAHYIGALDRAINKAYGKGYNRLTDAQREALDAQMKSTTPDESIPESVRVALMDMRRSIAGLSGQYAEILQQQIEELQAQDNNADAAEKAMLLETIIDNMDTYAHRSYRAFDDPDWAKKVPEDVWSRAVEYLQSRYEEQGMTAQEAEQAAIRTGRTILEEGTAYDQMSGFIKESKLGAKDLSTLKRRKDIAPEIRDLLGEYKDVKINYAKTLAKMSRLVANTELLDRIKEIGLAEGWLFTEESKPLDESVTKVAGDASEVYAPLNGYYVPNDVNQALIDTLGKEQMADWLRAVIRMNGLVKYGKAQPLTSTIYTPGGPVAMGDLKVGDEVCGANGRTRVTGIFPQGAIETYRINFSDGAEVEVSGEHLWEVNLCGTSNPRIMTTDDLRALPEYRIAKRQVSVPVAAADFDEQPVPVDPYTLGALLGDGSFRSPATVRFSSVDEEILQAVSNGLPANHAINHPKSWAACDYTIVSMGQRDNEIRLALSKLGLWGKCSKTKFIPDIYKYNSRDVRLGVVRGLLDTDGWVVRDGQPALSVSNERLARDFAYICTSLGMPCLVTQKKTSGADSFTVKVRCEDARELFSLTRKREMCRIRKKPVQRTIVSIEPIGKQECQCIQIEDDRHLYMTDGFVLTHNTVLSPTTAFRNWMSAAFFAMANGHFDMTQMRKSISGMKEYFGKGENPEKVAYLRKLKELGVVYDTAYAGEMMELLADSNIENTWFQRGPLKGLKDANDLAQKFYQYGDDFWKIIGYENEKAMLMKYKGMTEAAAEVEAAERIRNTYPTYSMTGRAVNWLRRFPLAGTFVSFPAEIIRTQFHMLRYLKQDWKDSKAYAARKTLGLAVVSGMAYAAQALSKDLFDIGDDEEEAVRLMAAEWNANSNIWFMGRDEDGNLRYLDFSFLDPYNYFKRPINAIMRDQPLDKAAIQAGQELLSPFFGQDIAAGAISEIWNNKKDSGGRVYNPQDTALGQMNDIGHHLRKAIQPGFVANIERAIKAANGEVSASGKRYKAEEEVAAFFGFRPGTFDPKTALYYNSFEFKDKKRDATAVLMNVAKNPNKVSDSDLMSAYQTAHKARLKAYTDMIRLIEAAKAAGMSRYQIMQSLSRSGISKADISGLLAGRIPRWMPSQATMRNTIRKAELLYGPEVVREMRARERAIMQQSYRQ